MRGRRWAGNEDRGRSTRRIVLRVAGVLTLLVAIVGFVLAYETLKAREALNRAENQSADLRRQIVAGNVEVARSSLADLKDSTQEAESHTDGFLWDAAARTPLVGQNFAAVHDVSRVLHAIADDGLSPLVDIAGRVNADAFSPRKGRIDIEPIRALSPDLRKAAQSLTRARSQLRQINANELVGPLHGPVTKVQTKVADAHSTVGAAAKAAELIPGMLGDSGRRSYILAFQNNAEIRSTGGLPGAFAILNANNGKVSLGAQGTGSTFNAARFIENPPIEATADEKRLYSILLTGYWGDTTLTPDFPRTAEIMRAMVGEVRSQRTDGVISLDPIALSYILKATGPVKLADDRSLNSGNAVKRLLNDVYFEIPNNDARDDYLADAARRIFAAVVSGSGDSKALLRSMSKAVGENRILIESARDAEQRILESTRIAGELPGDEGSTPHLGIFYNDATQTKLEYYLRKQTTVRATKCTRDGAQSLSTTTVLRSVAPKKVRSLPKSIIGTGDREKPGYFRMILTHYAPYGGSLTHLEVDGEEELMNRAEHDGLNVVSHSILLAPGQKVTVKTSMFTGKDQRDDAVFATTPGIEATPNNVNVPSACD
jgi:hypothetical protein